MSSDTTSNAPETETPEKKRLDLDIKVDTKSACERHVTVTVSKQDVQRYFEEAFSELVGKANVPGFRSGRAPRRLVESRFRGEVSEQVKGSLLMDTMTQITEDAVFAAISEPDFDFGAIEVQPDEPLKFEFGIEVRPEFDIPRWKGLKLERTTRAFDKTDIDQQLARMLENQCRVVPIDGPVEKGDYVVVNLTFKYGGKEVSTAEEQLIRVVDSLSFPDANLNGFAEVLQGAQAGQIRRAKLTVSLSASNEELCGKDLDVDILVLDVKRRELPEMTPELLEKLGGFRDEGDLRDAIQKALDNRLRYEQQQQARKQIAALLVQSADWDLPPDLLRRQARREIDRFAMELRSSGFSEEEIHTRTNEMRQNILESTKRALKEHFILERIAEAEGVQETPEDYDLEIAKISLQSGEPPRRTRARLEKQGQMDILRNQIIENKVIGLITEQAVFHDVPQVGQELTKFAVGHPVCGTLDSYIPVAKHDDAEGEALTQPSDYT
jgi:trigger factor